MITFDTYCPRRKCSFHKEEHYIYLFICLHLFIYLFTFIYSFLVSRFQCLLIYTQYDNDTHAKQVHDDAHIIVLPWFLNRQSNQSAHEIVSTLRLPHKSRGHVHLPLGMMLKKMDPHYSISIMKIYHCWDFIHKVSVWLIGNEACTKGVISLLSGFL